MVKQIGGGSRGDLGGILGNRYPNRSGSESQGRPSGQESCPGHPRRPANYQDRTCRPLVRLSGSARELGIPSFRPTERRLRLTQADVGHADQTGVVRTLAENVTESKGTECDRALGIEADVRDFAGSGIQPTGEIDRQNPMVCPRPLRHLRFGPGTETSAEEGVDHQVGRSSDLRVRSPYLGRREQQLALPRSGARPNGEHSPRLRVGAEAEPRRSRHRRCCPDR